LFFAGSGFGVFKSTGFSGVRSKTIETSGRMPHIITPREKSRNNAVAGVDTLKKMEYHYYSYESMYDLNQEKMLFLHHISKTGLFHVK